MENQPDFRKAADQLFEMPDKILILDLCSAGFVGSAFFGELFVLNHRIESDQRKLIIRTTRQLLSIMELLGLPSLVEIEIVEN